MFASIYAVKQNAPRWRGLHPRRPALGVRFLHGNLRPKIAEVQPILGIGLKIRHVPIEREMAIFSVLCLGYYDYYALATTNKSVISRR